MDAMDYLEDIDIDDVEMDDFTDEDNDDMDEFFGRRGRAKRKSRRKARGSRVRSKISAVKKRVANTHQERKRRVRKNVAMLKAMANPSFMAKRENRQKLRRRVKGLVKEVNGATGLLINKRKNCRCRPLASQIRRRRRRNFDGFNADGTEQSSMKKIWTNYKIPIIVGGAVVFFFFTPYGKKMIGK